MVLGETASYEPGFTYPKALESTFVERLTVRVSHVRFQKPGRFLLHQKPYRKDACEWTGNPGTHLKTTWNSAGSHFLLEVFRDCFALSRQVEISLNVAGAASQLGL